MSIDQAIEAEAQAQAICMQTSDFGGPTTPSSTSRRPSFSATREGPTMSDKDFLTLAFFRR